MILSLPERRSLRGGDFRGGVGGGEGFADGVKVGLVDVGGKLVEEAVELGSDVGGEAAGEIDVVEDGAELLFVALDGAHGVEEDVDAVGDLEVLLVGGLVCGLPGCWFDGSLASSCFGFHSWPFRWLWYGMCVRWVGCVTSFECVDAPRLGARDVFAGWMRARRAEMVEFAHARSRCGWEDGCGRGVVGVRWGVWSGAGFR